MPDNDEPPDYALWSFWVSLFQCVLELTQWLNP